MHDKPEISVADENRPVSGEHRRQAVERSRRRHPFTGPRARRGERERQERLAGRRVEDAVAGLDADLQLHDRLEEGLGTRRSDLRVRELSELPGSLKAMWPLGPMPSTAIDNMMMYGRSIFRTSRKRTPGGCVEISSMPSSSAESHDSSPVADALSLTGCFSAEAPSGRVDMWPHLHVLRKAAHIALKSRGI